MATEKCCLPLPPPHSGYFKSNPRATLSPEEEKMYNEVLTHFSIEDYSLQDTEKGELMDEEKFWLSRECLLRFLRASKWKLTTAIERIEVTLKWRRDYGMYDILNADLVEPEAVTGKEILFGYDVKGKPAFYMIPSRQNTDGPPRQIQFAVWMLERCIDLMEPGVENIALLINFADRTKNPSIGTARAVLHILQEYYPERLGLALIINVPFLVNAFFKIVMPFVDPITREKVKFNPDVIKDGFFDKDQLMSQWWDGTHDFEYVHEEYWKELIRMCDERVTRWKKKWRNLGAKVGVSEWDYKEGGGRGDEEGSEQHAGDDKNAECVTVVPVLEKEEVETTKTLMAAADEDQHVIHAANTTTLTTYGEIIAAGAVTISDGPNAESAVVANGGHEGDVAGGVDGGE